MVSAAEVPGMAGTYTLAIVQGERLRRDFQRRTGDLPQSLAGMAYRAQVRQKESPQSALLLDLTPYLTLDVDGVTLHLSVPATVTGRLQAKAFRPESSWDLFLWPQESPDDAFLLLQGPVTLDPSSTDMSGQ